MRLNNSIKNIKFSIVGQFVGIIVSFLARIIFIKVLSAEYLGVNGLFSNILSMLSLVELGIGPAITFSLYKPLAEHDDNKVKSLMNLYKKAYIFIGLVIFILGGALTPFIHIFIKNMPNIINIRFIYVLFVINSAMSYFYAYKRNLIIADQKKYIATFFRYSFFVVLNILQIIILIMTRSFILFLIAQIFITILENICISKVADKTYPYLKESDREAIDDKTKSTIIKNIKAMIMHKIGGVVVMSTDNLIISSYVGIREVGLYSNYLLIINALNSILAQFFQAIIASVGNLASTENVEKTHKIFNVVLFINFWLYGFSAISLVSLFNSFITVWLGRKYIFDFYLVLLIVVSFYLTGMRQATMTFRSALGLYWQDRYKAIVEAIINTVVSLALVSYIGFAGVVLGTIISTLLTCSWIEPYILYKYGFKKPSKVYFLKYFIYTVTTIVVGYFTYKLTLAVALKGICGFMCKAIICLIVPNLMFWVFYRKTSEFTYIIDIIKSRFK